MSILIVADVAGQFHALQRLVDRVSPKMDILLLGDLIDRGPMSYEVVEWAMKNPDRVECLLGNHEHMMLDFYRNLWSPKENPFKVYMPTNWLKVGGINTIESYKRKFGRVTPPIEHLEWMLARPLSFEINVSIPDIGFNDRTICTHAPIHPMLSLEEACAAVHEETDAGKLGNSVIWCRRDPREREYFHIHGHNSDTGLHWYENDEGKRYGVCLDQSSRGILTGLVYPECEILEEKY